MEVIKSFWDCEMTDVAENLKSGIVKVEGYKDGTDEIIFYCKNGNAVVMYHEQDCCENVSLESADGLVNGVDIFTNCDWCEIEEVSSEGAPKPNEGVPYWDDSYTWTFYKFKTNKGYDFMRWLGTSSGYYSERVDFEIRRWQDD